MGTNVFKINQVVLADDDADHGVLFKTLLQEVDSSKNVTILHDGDSLLAYLAHTAPELLFLDLNMPCKSGLECLQEIKKMDHLKNMKIVVYSSSSSMNDIHSCYMWQADLYMVKPFNREHLKIALKSVLNLDWAGTRGNKYYYINNRFVPYTASPL